MAGVLLPFLKWFIGGSGTKSLKLLNFVVRSPWKTIEAIGEVRSNVETCRFIRKMDHHLIYVAIQ